MKLFVLKQDILKRLKIASKSASDADLARFLGVAPATLSNWKTRGSIDYDLVFSKCEYVDLDWLLTGRGSMLRDEQPAQAPVQVPVPTIIYKSDPRDLKTIEDKTKIIALQEDKIRMLEEKLAVHAAGLGFAPAADTPLVGGAQSTPKQSPKHL